MSTRGWNIKSTTNPVTYSAEKQGFKVLSEDGVHFRVEDPDGEVVCNDLGTSLEAHRLAEACINRKSTG